MAYGHNAQGGYVIGCQAMAAMSDAEADQFLTSGARIAKLGTLRDGWPYVSPVWYEWDGKAFWVLGKPLAQFVENVKHDDRAFLVIDKEDFPYARVNVEARARVVSEVWTDEWVDMTKRMTVRYVGNLDYLEARLKYPVSVVSLTPERMNTWRVTTFPPDRTFTTKARWRERGP
jgi:nitroimidazol reductase NimA-like FMN-containing flavoprotein (pyridoxamine 5'-phosphate oxidase superfamily)